SLFTDLLLFMFLVLLLLLHFFLIFSILFIFFFFFFNDTATTEIYTLSLHDALPISLLVLSRALLSILTVSLLLATDTSVFSVRLDRKSTRLNSSHVKISYAVFCLKKKKTQKKHK